MVHFWQRRDVIPRSLSSSSVWTPSARPGGPHGGEGGEEEEKKKRGKVSVTNVSQWVKSSLRGARESVTNQRKQKRLFGLTSFKTTHFTDESRRLRGSERCILVTKCSLFLQMIESCQKHLKAAELQVLSGVQWWEILILLLVDEIGKKKKKKSAESGCRAAQWLFTMFLS